MSKRASIYLTDRTQQLVGDLKEGDSLSGRINAIADRYSELITRARRTVLARVDRDELEILRNLMLVIDTTEPPAAQLIGMLSDEVLQMSISDTGTDYSKLLRTLAELSPVEELALIEWLETDLFRSVKSAQQGGKS